MLKPMLFNSYKKSFWLIVIFAFIQQSLIAQNNFKEAKIVTLENDTIQGYINYQNWNIMPKSIQFKKNLAQSKAVTYSITNLVAFDVNGEIYQRRIAEIDKSPYIVDNLVPNAKPNLVVDTFFVQALVLGTISLYYLKDDQPKIHFFIETVEKGFKELINRIELKELIDGVDGIKKNEQYKKQLAFAMSDCPTADINFPMLSYTKKSLIKTFKKHNKCKGEQSQYYVRNVQKVAWHLGGTAGISLTGLKFITINNNNPNFVDLTTTDFRLQPNFALAVRLDAVLPRSRQRWRIINELMFRTHSNKGNFSVVESGQDYRYGSINIGLIYLGLNTMIRYQMPLSNIQPFFNIGFGNSFSRLRKNEKNITRHYWGIDSQETKLAIERTRAYEQSTIIGIGVARNQLNAEFRLITGAGINDYLLLGEKSSLCSLLFSYMF